MLSITVGTSQNTYMIGNNILIKLRMKSDNPSNTTHVND
jgi:hypothetical protein